MTARTVSARDLEAMLPDATEVELPGPEGGWATATINGRSYRALVAPVPVEHKTPEQWCAELGARIADPDGWRDGTRRWDEAITREEFDRRLLTCTIDSRGYPEFRGVPASEETP